MGLCTGGMSVDPDDRTPLAIRNTGARVVSYGAPVLPGDLFETKCRITRAKHPFYFAEGEGYVGDTLCVKAEFSFGITEREVCFQRS